MPAKEMASGFWKALGGSWVSLEDYWFLSLLIGIGFSELPIIFLSLVQWTLSGDMLCSSSVLYIDDLFIKISS